MEFQHVLFDNYGGNLCLVKYLEMLARKYHSNNQYFITRFDLKYNSVFAKLRSKHPKSMSLFSYLTNNNSTGRYLFNDIQVFNDIQGLKYDFNFFHQ